MNGVNGVKPGEWGEGWTTSSLPLPLWTLWICLFTQTVMNFQLHGTEKSCTSPSVLGLELRRDALITMLLIFNEWKIKLYVHDKTLLLMLVYLGLWDYPQLICDWYKKFAADVHGMMSTPSQIKSSQLQCRNFMITKDSFSHLIN